MKRSSGLRSTATFSESVHHQLNMYALAASAAGVGMLALAGPAEGKIVYTRTDKHIAPNHTIPLDLNHDGTIDFRFKDMHFTSPTYGFDHTGILSILPAHRANKVEGYSRTNRHYASALQAGALIGAKAPFKSGPRVMATVFSDTGARRFASNSCNGPWSKDKGRYLGLDSLGSSDHGVFSPAQTLGVPNGVEPASLGVLALGAQRFALGRRKESAVSE